MIARRARPIATPLVIAAVGAVLVWLGVGAMQNAMKRNVPHLASDGTLQVTREWAGHITDPGDFRVGVEFALVGLVLALPATVLIGLRLRSSGAAVAPCDRLAPRRVS